MSTFAEKLNTARYLSRQVGPLWAKRILRNLSPDQSLAIIHELERNGMVTELNLDIPGWRTEQLVVRCHTIEPAATLTIPFQPPLGVEAHGWQPYQARELQGVSLDIDSGLAFSANRVIAQSGTGTRASRDAAFVSGATARVVKTRPTIINQPIAPLGDVHHHYHFMIETLPRMLHAREMNPSVEFVTSTTISPRYLDLLDQLQFRIQCRRPGEIVIGNPLVLVDQPDLFWPRQSDLLVLRESLGDTNAPADRLLYLSRGSSSRKPANENDLERELASAGFEVLDYSHYTIQEQWTMAQEARVLAGPHGAALVAVSAMAPDAKLFELSSGELFESCYRRIAQMLQVRYRFVPLPACPSVPFGNSLDAYATLLRAEVH